jgi:hypothetical protein
VIGPYNFLKINFCTKLHFPYVLVIFYGAEREVAGFQLKEIKLLLAIISSIKTVYFYVKWFYMIRGVKIKCFFTLKMTRKTYLSSGRFLILSFGMVFYAFGGYILV